ncbi:MAG: PIN domain nuclease, partial [Clostridia bacterium]|nr:PIN domain nuclease [Clostridia bacterium]
MRMALRFAFAAAGLSVGFYLAAQFLEMLRGAVGFAPQGLTVTAVLVAGAMFCGLAGFLLGPLAVYKSAQCARWLETRLFRTPGPDILAGAAGLILGLVVAFLAGPALSRIPWVGNYLPLLVSVLLGYLGWVVAVNKREDLWSLVRKGRERAPDADVPQAVPSPVKVIDTSAIIDGRIADLCRTGFLEGQLVVPAFVLDELRHIADSSDALKRNRGRRGLDILNRIQKELGIPVKIYDRDVSSSVEVDMKLVELARALNGKIVTNDFNLNKVAGLH